MMNSRTIVAGAVTLGAPLYLKDKFQGNVSTYFKPVEECGYEFIEVHVPDIGYKFCVIEGNNIYIPDDVLNIENGTSEIELWCGKYGLIGAGDINDGEQIYYRNHGDTSVKLESKSFICEQYRDSELIKHEGKWSCSSSATVKIKLDFYQNDVLKYLIPVAFYSYDSYRQKYIDVFKIAVYYCNKHSLTNLF